MPPTLVLSVWLVSLLALFCFDPAREPKASAALWVPLIWLFFIASRTPSMWLQFSYASSLEQALEEGNPLDRAIFSLLILLAFVILVSRSFQWRKFVSQNSALVLFLGFALLSVAWSDFPLATFKKWFRDAGLYLAVLVILTDRNRLEAVRTVLRRLYYLTVPLSIVLVNYYPNLGRTWSRWGSMEFAGVSTSKNMLGLLCLASGIFFFWDAATRWNQRRDKRVRRIILVNTAFIGMALYLLNLCGSKTSTVCLILGCLMIAAAQSKLGQRHIGWLKVMAPSIFLIYWMLTFFGLGGQMSEAVGGTADMSDRTRIWQVLLSVPINPLVGCGYQSFWLGPRIQWVWERLTGDNVFEAHNGYLQTYLDLGVIGVLLVCAFLIATYRRICKQLNPLTPLASLSLGLWSLLLLYNVTEAALGGGLLWLTLLMGSMPVPERAKVRARASSKVPRGATLVPEIAADGSQ
ncbi:MAG TPA: O-antigen ligase family protein [Terriglobales bacterium]|jgi:exopolysaccharide production protein ExoQ|nr:O-antigen ligase family protein [Terriglobales bacterium]